MAAIKEQFIAYTQLMRLEKPIGTFLLLWPTWWALWLSGNPEITLIIIFSIGVFLMRSAGCVVNDFADRHFDGKVARTCTRPLPMRRVSEQGAKILFLSLVCIAFLLVLTLNRLTIIISFFAILLAIIYPFMKRYTHLPQLFLGLAYSSSIPMAYAATIGTFPLTCWLLFAANLCWIMAYDTEYALVDKNDDLKIGIKSTAILFGHYDKLIIGLLQMVTLLLLTLIGLMNQLADFFYISLVGAAVLFLWQHTLIRHRDPVFCFHAFLSNNYVGMVVWLGIITGL